MGGHRSAFNFAFKAITNDKFIALAPFAYEERDLCEIVAAVGITHNDELTIRLFDAFTQGAAVAFNCGVDYARSMLFSNFN